MHDALVDGAARGEAGGSLVLGFDGEPIDAMEGGVVVHIAHGAPDDEEAQLLVVADVQLLVDAEGEGFVEGADLAVVGNHHKAVGAFRVFVFAEPANGCAPAILIEGGLDLLGEGGVVGAGATVEGGREVELLGVGGEEGGTKSMDGRSTHALMEIFEINLHFRRRGGLVFLLLLGGRLSDIRRAEDVRLFLAVFHLQAHALDSLAVVLDAESFLVLPAEPNVEEVCARAGALSIPGDDLTIGRPNGVAIPGEAAREIVGLALGVVDGENPNIAIAVVIADGDDEPTSVGRPVVAVDALHFVETPDDLALGVCETVSTLSVSSQARRSPPGEMDSPSRRVESSIKGLMRNSAFSHQKRSGFAFSATRSATESPRSEKKKSLEPSLEKTQSRS